MDGTINLSELPARGFIHSIVYNDQLGGAGEITI